MRITGYGRIITVRPGVLTGKVAEEVYASARPWLIIRSRVKAEAAKLGIALNRGDLVDLNEEVYRWLEALAARRKRR